MHENRQKKGFPSTLASRHLRVHTATEQCLLSACWLVGSLLIGPPAIGQTALTCPIPDSPVSTPPCGASSSLGPSPEPRVDTGISNPIQVVSGEKFLRDIDLPESILGSSPAFIRLYRSSNQRSGPLGTGWSLEYDIHLQADADGYTLMLADGRAVHYNRLGGTTRYLDGHIMTRAAALDDDRRPAVHQPPAYPPGTEWVWLGPDGRRLGFDAQGQLRSIHHPGHPAIEIQRHAQGPYQGLIQHIRQGQQDLNLHYAQHAGHVLLQSLETPLGTFSYTYQPVHLAHKPTTWQLIRVQRPDGMQRHYLHEAAYQAGHPHAITGIALSRPSGARWQARSWTYDSRGRVIEAIPGDRSPTAPRLALSYPPGAADIELRWGQNHQRWQAAAPADGLQIRRYPDGRIGQLRDPLGGWPGLVLDYAPTGLRRSWSATLSGQTQVLRSPQGHLQGFQYANGDRLDIRLDAVNRPVTLTHQRLDQAPISVQIQWRGRQPSRLKHPAETEFLNTDEHGRLQTRHVRRPLSDGVLQYQENFVYNRAGQLLRHDLPEGGALHYRWAPDGILQGIRWEDTAGRQHAVIDTVDGLAGYRYGNGLHLQTRVDAAGRTDLLVLSRTGQAVWGERRHYDDQGRVAQRLILDSDGQISGQALAHDAQGRLVGIKDTATTRWLAWSADGSLLRQHRQPSAQPATASQNQGTHQGRQLDLLPTLLRDAAGLPQSIGLRQLEYQAQQRLSAVHEGQAELVRYTYNARGQQIRQQSRTLDIERYYLDNRLVGRWLRPRTNPPAEATTAVPRFGLSERYIYAQDALVGRLRYDAQGNAQLDFIHSDLLGVPVLTTDAQGQVRWQARYDALGRLDHQSGDLPVVLRLPGQDEDPFTGWHDNVFRTYLPQSGHYLEPDPLGPLPGQQALGYAAQQPLRHTDPLGLILLAFDGTRYGQANQSNVWKLAQAYSDGQSYYHAGPGSNLYMNWDAITAASSGQILRNQWQSLLNALQRAQRVGTTAPIDILGYSRGAALARDFANRIAQQTRNGWFSYDDPLRGTIGLCVDLRFLGLFDTVAQFGLLGAANAGFDLGISDAWSRVAHAVATHEMRSLFPLVSAGGMGNTTETPFIGAHADIGGGGLLDDTAQAASQGDLSDVALNWMYWQAAAALVPLRPLSADDQQITQPLLHDERMPAQRMLDGDRDLQDAQTRSLGPQGNHPRLGAGQRALFETFIQRIALWQLNAGNMVGTVDMQGYGAWLATQQNGP
ncbi:phospholipase effector Tle1 domain-containing protein [Castellaniella sp.]|uniref:phospholipase effector Tle1 domain-containing protein n=1 Tax=Castellaniella sp. TaxID=1955812 RepID=UPI002AFF513E|nr:DUF2235 domain-containing protein [Castellaniella sp.]